MKLYSDKRKEADYDPVFTLPKKCGVSGCNNPCDVYVHSRAISRCASCYSKDLSIHKHGCEPRVMGEFQAEDDIMKSLQDAGMLQCKGESPKEYAKRCRQYLQTEGGELGKLVSGKYGSE